MTKLTIFYDGRCPLCVMEMSKLSLHDHDRALKLVDIQQPEIESYPSIDPLKASQILHAIDDQQTLLLGLDVTYRAWTLVGKGWIYAPLRWPGIRLFADSIYIRFARNRYRWSKWLTGKSYCDNGQCSR